jgi:hypothetical protein
VVTPKSDVSQIRCSDHAPPGKKIHVSDVVGDIWNVVIGILDVVDDILNVVSHIPNVVHDISNVANHTKNVGSDIFGCRMRV